MALSSEAKVPPRNGFGDVKRMAAIQEKRLPVLGGQPLSSKSGNILSISLFRGLNASLIV